MAGRFSVEAVFKAVDRVTAPVTRMQNRVGKFTRSASRNFHKLNRTVDKFGRGIKRGAKYAAAGFAVVSGVLAKILGAGVDFEQAITNVGAVALKTRAQIAPLEKQALQLGRTTKFTATQAANAMEILAKAGFNTQQILKATPAVLSAAAASGMEIAEVAGHVSNVLKGMGLDMSQSARVADVLALASARTNSTIGSLGESMKNVAAKARQLGVPLEDAVAAIALLQDVGLDASGAGSAFNVMLTKMAAPSAKIEKVMRRLGLSFKKVNGDMKTLQAVIAEINKATAAMGGNFDQVAFLAELVGLRGEKAAGNLGELFKSGKAQTLTRELKSALGVADKMAALRMNTVQGSMLLLSSAVDAVKVKLFGLNRGPLKKLIDETTKWVNENDKFLMSNLGDFLAAYIKAIVFIAKNGGAIIDTTKWILGLVIAFKALVAVLTIVNLLMVTNHIVLMALGVIALIAAIAALVIWWDELVDAFMRSSVWVDIIVAGIGFLLGPVGLLIAAAVLLIKQWEPIKEFFSDMWDGVVAGFKSALRFIAPIVDKIIGKATAIISTVKSLSSGVSSFLGFGDDEAGGVTGGQAQIVSPQDRTARKIDEQRTTSSAEVTIRDETGRAEVTGGKLAGGLSLQQSGAF